VKPQPTGWHTRTTLIEIPSLWYFLPISQLVLHWRSPDPIKSQPLKSDPSTTYNWSAYLAMSRLCINYSGTRAASLFPRNLPQRKKLESTAAPWKTTDLACQMGKQPQLYKALTRNLGLNRLKSENARHVTLRRTSGRSIVTSFKIKTQGQTIFSQARLDQVKW
jgi:hypothetical protein